MFRYVMKIKLQFELSSDGLSKVLLPPVKHIAILKDLSALQRQNGLSAENIIVSNWVQTGFRFNLSALFYKLRWIRYSILISDHNSFKRIMCIVKFQFMLYILSFGISIKQQYLFKRRRVHCVHELGAVHVAGLVHSPKWGHVRITSVKVEWTCKIRYC